MAKKTILSKNQIKILQAISSDELFCKEFYLTGGTALAEFYLQHRLSEDLDFFSEKEFDTQNAKGQAMEAVNQYHKRCFQLFPEPKDIIFTELVYGIDIRKYGFK